MDYQSNYSNLNNFEINDIDINSNSKLSIKNKECLINIANGIFY